MAIGMAIGSAPLRKVNSSRMRDVAMDSALLSRERPLDAPRRRSSQDASTKAWTNSRPIGSPSALAGQRQGFWEPVAQPECSLEEKPLVLLGDVHDDVDSPENLIWDESRRCFAARWPRLLSPDTTRAAFEALRAHACWEPLRSKRGQIIRETCWYVRGGCRCDYTYGASRIGLPESASEEFTKAMESLLERLCKKLCPWMPRDEWPNSANLNLYSGAAQSVGWHADDESLFRGRDSDCPIISISLGCTREFWIALRDGLDSMEVLPSSIIEADLGDGDVLTMEGLCQKHCIHFVPSESPSAKKTSAGEHTGGARINVTWRWIRDHKAKCPLHVKHGHKDVPLFTGAAAAVPKHQRLFQKWSDGRITGYRQCDLCKHDAWRDGRPCVQDGGKWVCRLCQPESRLSGLDRQGSNVVGKHECSAKSPERTPETETPQEDTSHLQLESSHSKPACSKEVARPKDRLEDKSTTANVQKSRFPLEKPQLPAAKFYMRNFQATARSPIGAPQDYNRGATSIGAPGPAPHGYRRSVTPIGARSHRASSTIERRFG